MNIFKPLAKKLAPKPAARAFLEDDERRLRRMTNSKAWTNYLDLVDYHVNLLSEQMLQAPQHEVSHIVAEIRGVRKVPEYITNILRGIDHERSAAAKRAESGDNGADSNRASFFASPFWRSDANVGTPLQ